MLRFQRDHLHIGVEPDRLVLARLSSRTAVTIKESRTISLNASDSETVFLEVLEAAFQSPALQNADSHLVLSDRLVRYFVAERPPGARNIEEVQLAAALRFEDLFGVLASDWDIRLDMHPFATSQLGCAIKKSLVSGLVRVCAQANAPVASIVPFAVSEFNRSHALIGNSHGWFAVLGRHGLWVGRKEGYDWLSAHQYSLEADLAGAISRHMTQEQLHAPVSSLQQTRSTWFAGYLADEKLRKQLAAMPAQLLSAPHWIEQTDMRSAEFRLALSSVWPRCD